MDQSSFNSKLCIKCMALRENHEYSVSNKEIQDLNEQAQKYAERLSGVFDESHKVIIGQQDALKKILISIISDGLMMVFITFELSEEFLSIISISSSLDG